MRSNYETLQAKHADLSDMYVALREKHQTLTDENDALRTRNIVLEANTLHVQAELRRREEELVEAGKDAEVCEREREALRAANNDLLEEVEELQQRDKARAEEIGRTREINKKNADGYYAAKLLAKEAEDKAIALECGNARLRKALLEQATVFAATLNAVLSKP